jgi:mannosyltransferase
MEEMQPESETRVKNGMSAETSHGVAPGLVVTGMHDTGARGITHYISRIKHYASKAVIPVALLTLLAFILRRYHLGDESLWFDEADIVSRARQPVSVLIQGFTQAGENGPLYTLLLHYWVAALDALPLLGKAVHFIFGAAYEAPVRALSLLFGVASVPPMYILARRVGGHWVGLLAAALLALNPFHIWHSQDAKMYSLLVLMTLVSTLLYLSALRRNTLVLWGSYVAATWVMLTTHSMGILVLLAQLVATPFLLRSRTSGTARRGRLVRWGWAMLLIMGPLFPIVWLRVAALLTNTVDVGGWYAPAGLHDIFGTVLVNFAVNRSDPLWEVTGAVMMAALALLGTRRLISTNHQPAVEGAAIEESNKPKPAKPEGLGPLIVALWLLPIAGLWLVSLRVPLFQARYLIMALPAYLVLVAMGLVWLKRRQPLLAAVPGILLVMTTGVALAGVNYSTQPQKEDWRGAMVYVQDHARLRDVIIVFPGYLRTAVDVYYKTGGPGRVPDIPMETVPSLHTQGFGKAELRDYLARAVTCHERAWLVTSPSRQQQEDPQNSVQQWLQYNYRTFDTRQFNGVTLYGITFNGQPHCWYPGPQYEELHMFENGLEFVGYIYELRDGATAQPDASYFPLTLYWRTSSAPGTNYLVNIRVRDAAGRIVKEEALGTLNGYWPTSDWPRNTQIIDYRDIRLPGSLTPGSYTISLQLYPEGHPESPIKLQDGSAEIVLQEPLQIVPWQP